MGVRGKKCGHEGFMENNEWRHHEAAGRYNGTK
jgi:hypothetical protein